MALSFLSAGSGEGITDDDSADTPSLDTTGADLIIVGVTGFSLAFNTITDNKSNTWVELTNVNGGGNMDSVLFYSLPDTVGTGHVITYAETGSFPVIGALSFSGGKSTQSPDESTGTHTGATSAQAGIVTPVADGSVIAQLLVNGSSRTGMAIDNSYIHEHERNFVSSQNVSFAMAYLIQGTAADTNPTWTWSGSEQGSQAAATFEPAVGAEEFRGRQYPQGIMRGIMRGVA
ncbi:MAG: hypothetical protein V3S55_09950 [Nitrospiraceae bacterium]